MPRGSSLGSGAAIVGSSTSFSSSSRPFSRGAVLSRQALNTNECLLFFLLGDQRLHAVGEGKRLELVAERWVRAITEPISRGLTFESLFDPEIQLVSLGWGAAAPRKWISHGSGGSVGLGLAKLSRTGFPTCC